MFSFYARSDVLSARLTEIEMQMEKWLRAKKVYEKGPYLVCLNLHPSHYQTADKRIKDVLLVLNVCTYLFKGKMQKALKTLKRQ